MIEYIYNPPATLPPGSEVIAYLRDSGGPNQEDSINQQEQVIRNYCKQHGLILVQIFEDTASGRKTKKRDQFLEMFNSIITMPNELRPHGLLLWAYSRFSRDIIDFNFFLYGLMKHGLVVHSLTEQIPDGLLGQIMLSFKAYTNADFSEQLSKNIKRGIGDLVTDGYSNGGQPPRGYIVVRETYGKRRNGAPRIGIRWKADPELAPLVRLAWELRAQGKGYAEITKATMGKVYSMKNSWASHFRNKSYLGIGKAGDLEIPDHHEPLITTELWDAVKKVEKAAPRHGRDGDLLHYRRMKNPSLLSGLAFCIYCRSAMVLHTSPDYRSYACGKRERQRGYKDCTMARRVNARKADKLILETVLNRILAPAFVEDLLNDIQKQLVDTTKLDREIGDANNLLITTERSINRFIKLVEGTGDLDEIIDRLKELKRDKAELVARIKHLEAERELETPLITAEALALVFNTWRIQIENAFQTGDILKAKKLLAQFVQKIELGHNDAIIHYTYPIDTPAENHNLVSAHNKESLIF